MAAGLAARRCGGRRDGHVCLLFHVLAAALDGGPCGDLEGYPLLPHGLLEEHVDRLGGADAELREEPRRIVPRLPFLRTVTLTVSIGASFRYGCLMRPLCVRQAGFPENPSWRDGYPLRGDRNTPRPAPIRKDGTHDAVRYGCHLCCYARVLHVFPLFPFES